MKIQRILTLLVTLLVISGCNEKTGASKPPEMPQKYAEKLESQPAKPLILAGIKIEDDAGLQAKKIIITASGPFQFNVVPKADPDRILVVLHNTTTGKNAGTIKVGDGTISSVETVQLDTGKAPAVRITIGLQKKADYKVIPGEGSMAVAIRKQN